MIYFYKQTESSNVHTLWTVGYEDRKGNWYPDSDWNDQEKAAQRTAFLNGSPNATDPKKSPVIKDFDVGYTIVIQGIANMHGKDFNQAAGKIHDDVMANPDCYLVPESISEIKTNRP